MKHSLKKRIAAVENERPKPREPQPDLTVFTDEELGDMEDLMKKPREDWSHADYSRAEEYSRRIKWS